MQKKNLRLALSGGGSGGHLTPSLAVAQEFLRECSEGEVYFFISQNPLDESVLVSSGFRYQKIFSGKLRRYFSFQNLIDFFLFFFGIFQSLYFLKKFDIDLLFSKGGFVSLPVALAAWILQIPIIAHESDTVQGLANRVIASFAKKICITFPENQHENKKLLWTGTPIRLEILKADAQKGKKFLGIQDEKPIILFMGASQGAIQINRSCELLLDRLTKMAHVVLIAGKGKLIQDARLKQYEYLSDMFPHVLAASDIVISRAGANSLFELAALKKASIIIPLASAAGDHQRKNAQNFEKEKAIEYIEPNLSEKDLAQKIFTILQKWIDVPSEKKIYEENIGKLFVKDASKKILQSILLSQK